MIAIVIVVEITKIARRRSFLMPFPQQIPYLSLPLRYLPIALFFSSLDQTHEQADLGIVTPELAFTPELGQGGNRLGEIRPDRSPERLLGALENLEEPLVFAQVREIGIVPYVRFPAETQFNRSVQALKGLVEVAPDGMHASQVVMGGG